MTSTVECPHCGREVPPGEYCGACGAHLGHEGTGSTERPRAFAANPFEHLLQPSFTTTLFPHLPQRRSAPFRLALLVLAGALLIVGYLRLTGPSVALAAAAVPALFLVYLYDVDVYEAQPLFSIGVTAGSGIVLGALWAFLTGRFITQTQFLNATPLGAPLWRILLISVVFPLAVQLLMLIGALVLDFSRKYDEVLDGFTAGASASLGFVLAATLVNLFPEVQSGPLSATGDVPSALWTFVHGLLYPFIAATATALIAAAVWLRRGLTRRLPRFGWTGSLAVSVLVAAAVQIGLGLTDTLVVKAATVVLIYASVALALLMWVRIAVHHMLLAEVVDPHVGPEAMCFHCERVLPRTAFCPSCGGAVRATPKTGAGREGRRVR